MKLHNATRKDLKLKLKKNSSKTINLNTPLFSKMNSEKQER